MTGKIKTTVITKSDIEIEDLYKYLFFFYCILIVFNIKGMISMESFYKENGYSSTNNYEFLLIIPGTVYSILILWVIKCFSYDWIKKYSINSGRYTETVDEKIHRIQNMISSMVYYSTGVALNYYLIMNYGKSYMPTSFGGDLDIKSYHGAWPSIPQTPVRYYFIFTIGHHVERTMEHVFYKRANKNFWIMILHHILTINLMFNCIVYRQYGFGIPILFLHDIGDIFIGCIRFVREISFLTKYSIPAYICHLISWIGTRNIVFNIEIVIPMFSTCIAQFWNHGDNFQMFAAFGVTILVVLNTFWIHGSLVAGYNKLFKNKDVMGFEGEKNKAN